MRTQNSSLEAGAQIGPLAIMMPVYDLPKLEPVLSDVEVERLEAYEKEFEGLEESFQRAGDILLAIRDEQLWRGQYESFEEYCRKRWNMGARRGRQLAAGASVLRNLKGPDFKGKEGTGESSGPGTGPTSPEHWAKVPLPTNERQTRPLGGLPPEEVREVWKTAVDDAGGKVPTGKQVLAARAKIKGPPALSAVSARADIDSTSPDEEANSDELESGADPDVLKLAKKVFGIAMKAAGYRGHWHTHSHEAQLGFLAIAKWHIDTVKDLANEHMKECAVMQRRYAELTRKRTAQNEFCDEVERQIGRGVKRPEDSSTGANRGNGGRASGYVICREPLKGSVVKQVRYCTGGGWGNNPHKAKIYKTFAEARQVAFRHGDRAMTLEKAIRRFEHKLG